MSGEDKVRSRRLFLAKSLAVSGSAAMGGAALSAENLDNLPPNVPQWMRHEGQPLTWQAYVA